LSGYVLESVAKAICDSVGYDFGCGIGQGAFKETFSATQADGVRVAGKVLKPGCSAERSDREVEAMKRCAHPNVAALLELSAIDVDGVQYPFIIEAFMSGGTLEDRLRAGLISRSELLKIGDALIGAVDHIAAKELVHRDFKPANIMFADAQGDAVIGDFGIVRDLRKDSLTQTYLSSGPGTPFFAAPEQLTNDKALIDWRTDQFALAVTLVIAHFGFHPYRRDGENDNQAISRVASRSGPSPTFVQMATQVELPALIKMLAPWPVERFRTPSMLLNAWRAQRGGD
jgi:serine/threonine protein kinase